MRTAAVLFVLLSHSLLFLPFQKGKDFLFLYLGFIGVEIFFVLSGFLIGNIMYKAFRQKVDGPVMRNFWIRRWFRTLPLYYVTLVLNVILFKVYEEGSGLGFSTFLFPLFLQNFLWPHPHFFEPAWSLTIEEYFYLLFPLLMFLLFSIRKLSFNRSFLLSIVLFFLIPFLLRLGLYLSIELGLINKIKPRFIPNWDLYFRKITLFRLDAIALGILTAYFLNTAKEKLIRYKNQLMAGSLLLFIASSIIYYYTVHHYRFGIISSVFIFPLFSISFAISIPYLREIKSMGIFNKPVSFISKVSYSIYLLHPLVSILFIHHLQLNETIAYQLFLFVLFITVSLIISHFSFKYIEHPITEMREKFDNPKEKIATATIVNNSR